MDAVPRHSDAVVVGAGPAGALVARRLAEHGRRVVLVEAGPGGPRPGSVAGLDLVAASGEAGRHWSDLTVRDRPGRPPRLYRQGRGLGGGSMINGMLLTPGDRVDYDRWVGERGCLGWGPDDLEPWLDRARLAPSQRVEPGPVSVALAESAVADGLALGGTSLEPDRLGVLTAELSAVDGRRWSAVDDHLDGDGPTPTGVWDLPDVPLTVVTGRPVDRIVAVDGGIDRYRTGTGVNDVVLVGGETIRAELVVVCAGALGSPALLLRSGVTDRPVGRSLYDHPSYAFTLVLRDRPELAERLAASPPVVSTVVRWSSGPDHPGDLQAIAIDRVAPAGYQGPPLAVVAVGLMAVTSEGSFGLAGPDPAPAGAGPLGFDAVTGVLGTETDRRRLRDGVRRVGAWLATEPFDQLVTEVHLDDDGRPLDHLASLSDAELDAVLAARPGPYAHPAGTCPLGPDGSSRSVTAIDAGRAGELLDRPGIRVADASIFPHLVRGGLQLPVAAVASRIAADIVAGG